MPCSRVIAPGIVRIRQHLYAACVVDSDNITLQVLLEVEGIEGVGGIRGRSVLHADGGSRFVIQVDNQITAPRLTDDLGAVQRVNMFIAIDDLFVCSNTVGVVLEFQERLAAVAAHLPELANRHFPRPPAEQNALRVLDVLT